MSTPQQQDELAPTDAALQARLAAVEPRAYARTRNAIDGAVTRLSPYLTHGFTDVPEVIAVLRQRHRLRREDKLVYELAWREYFHHLWSRLGDGMFADLRPAPATRYASRLPDDIRHGATGVPVIDAAVRALYASGYLHNHARMWLAAYAIHLRKVHWRAGADWMYAHLLDGDLASNHLSWQWVAGTLTGKPYLFNAENVSRYVPRWASAGTSIDRGYDEIDRLARSDVDVGPQPGQHPGVAEPAALDDAPPGDDAPPANRPVELLHPWSLKRRQPQRAAVCMLVREFHRQHRWSARRWDFVLGRLRELRVPVLRLSSAQVSSMFAAEHVASLGTLNASYAAVLAQLALNGAVIEPVPRFFIDPPQPCRSFSQFWRQVGATPPCWPAAGRGDDAGA